MIIQKFSAGCLTGYIVKGNFAVGERVRQGLNDVNVTPCGKRRREKRNKQLNDETEN